MPTVRVSFARSATAAGMIAGLALIGRPPAPARPRSTSPRRSNAGRSAMARQRRQRASPPVPLRPASRTSRPPTSAPSHAAMSRAQGARRPRRGRPVHIPVYVHVVHHTNGTGNVSDQHVADQIGVLNAAFAGGQGGAASNYVFDLLGITRSANTTWFNGMVSSFSTEAAAKNALRQGGAVR